MPSVEELLSQAEPFAETGEAHEQGIYCIVHPDSRTIEVPEQYQLLGVENDKRVERLYFQCPKIVGDNQDLSQGYQLFVNYQNANGDPDAYHIDDMEIDGDNITFSWLLEENVTKYRGDIQFAFGAIKPGDEADDPDKNRWNTTINTDCICLVGLKCTQQVAESNPDALAQIWAAIDELKAGGGSGSGTPGKDGREIEIQNNGTAIQWRYVGDLDWTDLVQLSDLKGEGIPEGGTTGQVLTKNSDSDGDASWKNPSIVSDEQVKTAVDNYLEENPVQGGITEEQKQQLEQNTQDITDLKSALPDKLDSNQGVENKGKSMVVGEDGGLVPEDVKVPVDNTLSNEGEAADAKATGEELSKKVDVEKEINPEWEKWSDVRYNYGFDKNIQPIFNTIKGILETDTMISVRGGKGRWNKTDKPASEFVSGGHVFEGWSGKELARLTMLIGKFHEMFACIQTYSPAGLYQSTRRFGWVKLGSDEKNKGFDFSQGWSTCYTPLTFQPLSRPTTVMDYDLNPQFTLSTVPIGTLYYDQGENRFNVFTSNGWKSIAFTDDINNSNKEPTEPFSGNIEYTTMYPRKEDGIIANDSIAPYSAWFPVETSKSYKVTRSELTDRFRIYLYNSEDLDSAFSSKEPGFLVVEDANNNVLDSLVFTNNSTYKFALVLLDNERYYSKSVTISVLTSKN